MNLIELKSNLDQLGNIKTLVEDNTLIVSYRNLYVIKHFGCKNTCYVEVEFIDDNPVSVETFPKGMNCPLREHVDRELNVNIIQGMLAS